MRKRKIGCLILAAFLYAGSVLTVCAAEPVDGGTVQFTDSGMKSTFQDSAVRQEIGNLQPGDSVTIQLKLENLREQSTDWYMTNQVVKSLEDSSRQANGGAYTYELIYTNDAAGEVKVLYSSQNVGGEGSQDGLREATSAMGEYFYLGRLGAKGIGHIDLTIVLDPETIGNAYQNTLANLQMAFAVDTVSGGGGSGGNAEGGSGIGPASPVSAVFSLGGVQTGDADDFLLWSMAALVSGLVLMIWAIICFKRDKGGRRHA